jgi:hypothetical protein
MKAVIKKDKLYINFLFLFRDALGLWKESAAYGQVRYVRGASKIKLKNANKKEWL